MLHRGRVRRAAVLRGHELGRLELLPCQVAVRVGRRAPGAAWARIDGVDLHHRRAKDLEPLLLLSGRAVTLAVLALPDLELMLAARLTAAPRAAVNIQLTASAPTPKQACTNASKGHARTHKHAHTGERRGQPPT